MEHDSFIRYMKAKDLARATYERYALLVDKFKAWYPHDPAQCTKKDVLAYLSYLKDLQSQSNSTRACSLIALRHYYSHLLQSDMIDIDPTSALKIRGTKKKRLHTIFTTERLTALSDNYYHTYIRDFNSARLMKNHLDRSLWSKKRNHCMLGLLLFQGLATKELQRIDLADLDTIKATVRVRGGKRGNARTLTLHGSQIGSLIDYIQNVRPLLLELTPSTEIHAQSDQLFLPLPTCTQTLTTATDLLGTVKTLCKQVKRLDSAFTSFHQIRASVITHWIQTYGLRKAQYLAGHRGINSTEEYMVNDLESLTKDILDHHPF